MKLWLLEEFTSEALTIDPELELPEDVVDMICALRGSNSGEIGLYCFLWYLITSKRMRLSVR